MTPSEHFSRGEKAVLALLTSMGRMPRGELVTAMQSALKWPRKRCYAALWFMEKRHLLRRTPKGYEALAVRGVRVAEACARRTLFA